MYRIKLKGKKYDTPEDNLKYILFGKINYMAELRADTHLLHEVILSYG